MTIWKEALRFSALARSSILAVWKSLSSLLKGRLPKFRMRTAPLLSRAGSIRPALARQGAKGTSSAPDSTPRHTPTAMSPMPSSKHLSTMARVSSAMISSSAVMASPQKSWSASMFTTCLVQRRPAALASMVGMPTASWGVLTMTLVALARPAMALPMEITPKALASSAGKPPIHWCSTVVTTTSL